MSFTDMPKSETYDETMMEDENLDTGANHLES